MWRVGEKRPSRHSSYSVVEDQLSPIEPPRKRIKVAGSEVRSYKRRSWEVRGHIRRAWDSFVGGIHRLFRWKRERGSSLEDTATMDRERGSLLEATATMDRERGSLLEDTATMDNLHTQARVLNQQKDLPCPVLTSTPSQWPSPLTPMTSVQSVDVCSTSQVGTYSRVSDNSRQHAFRSEHPLQQSDTACLETNFDKQLSLIEKQVPQRASRKERDRKEYQPSGRGVDTSLPSREGLHGINVDRPLRERCPFNTGQTSREKYEFNVGWAVKEGRGSRKENVSVSKSISGGAGSRSSYMYMYHQTTPASQSTGDHVSLFTPVLSPEVIGPSLSLPTSSRSMRRAANSSISSSFDASASACEHTVKTLANGESPTPPATLSSVSQLPWQPKHRSSVYQTDSSEKSQPMKERGRALASHPSDDGEGRELALRGLSQGKGHDTQQMRRLLERIKLEHVRGVEDRKTMAELIQKKIHLHQSERMALEDARVSRLRQQLASSSMADQEGEGEEGHIETLTALSDNQVSKVRVAVSGGPSSECLSQKFNIRITRSDIGTLVGLQWLNDEVINFYFNMIKERSLETDSPRRAHVFNTFFYTKLSNAGYSGVRRWTKKVDVFEYDMVLVPIHLGMHWCLAAVDFRKKCVSYYDSLHGNNNACLRRLRDYLVSESKDKKGVDFDLTSWTTSMPKDIPHQMNGSDCGVFTCMYARFLSVGSPFQFSQEDMSTVRQHMIAEILEQKLF